jgi:hypothetical protein
MAKVFQSNYTPIEVDLVDSDSKVYNLKSNRMTLDLVQQMENIINDVKLNNAEKISKQLSLIFGYDYSFWSRFEMSLLGNVLEYVASESKKK